MENDIKVRKVTQDVLLFVWFKNKIITKEPSPELCFIPEISAELINNLSISVWMESFRNGFTWKDFVSNHFERMTSSTYLFANYVAYAFCVLGKTTDGYEYFFDVLSLVTYFGLHCWQRECKLFLNACVDLFCAFFEKKIRTKFENQGGWEHFNEYLEKHYTLNKYKSLISKNKSPTEYFQILQDELEQSNELNYKINGVFIRKVARRKVETHKKAVNFAVSVADKISELCAKEFDEIISDFARIDRQVKALYQQTVGEASGGMAREVANVSSQKIQKEASQNIPSECKPETKEQQRQTVTASDSLEIQNLGNLNSQDVDASDEALHDSPKSRQSESAKNLLGDISMDIAKLSDIIQSLCQEYGVQVPE
ncbi:hypothetical protein AVEN_3092-1 [Araneus ventricosus]|uniref:Uncharacterized protein n=1 Tax=Araneus ventricosus TaxID=182803 RepID=A0A4Y2RRS6_ARAVE|nr:hypothetical protein AVEN_3092-1 [Araneus ventricosus]